jgi:hypothetical protein
MAVKKRIRITEPVQVNKYIKARVARKVAGTKKTIGEFYDESALERLSKKIIQSNK